MSQGGSMLAVQASGPGRLRVERLPLPRPAAGELLLRVLSCGVCTTDRKIVARGTAGGVPLTLGHEIVAEVVETEVAEAGAAETGAAPTGALAGAEDRMRQGQRVAIAPNLGCGRCSSCRRGASNYCPEVEAFGIHRPGGMAEYLLLPEHAVAAGHLLPLPDQLATADAALLEPLACCLESLEACRLQRGESLLVVGGGVMGRLHVALARALGAGRVVLIDRHQQRRAHALALGADQALEAAAEGVLQANGGEGYDVVVVTVGQADAVEQAQGWLATGGRLNVFAGLPAAASQLRLDGNAMHYRFQQVLGTTGASLPTLRRSLELLAAGRVKTHGLVSAQYPLAEAAAAFEAAASRDHARVLLVNP